MWRAALLGLGCALCASDALAQDVIYDNGSCRMEVDGAELSFVGCNVNIQNGAGATDSTTGTGNLVLGYNEATAGQVRTGSHNLVVGPEHDYLSYGSVVSGQQNTVVGRYSAVIAGRNNTANGVASTILSGQRNTTDGVAAAVVAGEDNLSTGLYGLVMGGSANTVDGNRGAVIGGASNQVLGNNGVVLGEVSQVALADEAVVGGYLMSGLTALEADVAANLAAIDAHGADIAAQAGDIAINASEIASNAAGIAANVADITANAGEIATLASDLAGQAVEVAANTAAISDMAADLAAQATDVASNTTAIADLAAEALVADDLVGLATESWVSSQGYLSSVSWSDIPDVPADLADGDDGLTSVSWLDIPDVPADLADGDDGLTSVSWSDIPDVPADLADGDDGLTSVSWLDLTDVPADLADGDDGGIPGLETYLWVDEATDTVWVEGANLHVASGSGALDAVNGLGNLVLGYNLDDGGDFRSGSHNLVLGDHHSYSSYGGIVGGEDNEVAAPWSMVLSGQRNRVAPNSPYSLILAGQDNLVEVQTYDDGAFFWEGSGVVISGFQNRISAPYSVIATGERMTAEDGGSFNNVFALIGTGLDGRTTAHGSFYLTGTGGGTGGPYSIYP